MMAVRDAEFGGYDSSFYEFTGRTARESAEEIVPLVLALSGARSVVDVGCGIGSWLAVFERHHVEDVFGFDGPHVDQATLEIAVDRFRACDLEQALPIDRSFDLACCLEVAEHLSERRAGALIEDLVRLAPIVLFSAAIPLQGGIGHINEQWPTYWAEEFAKQGLVLIDAVRPAVWDNRRVAHWYSQNCLLFATEEAIRARPRLAEARDATSLVPVDLVHPSFYLFHRLNLPGQVARVPLDIASQESTGEPEPEPEPELVQTVEADETTAPAAVAAPVPPLGLRALLRQIPGATGLAVTTRWKRWTESRRRIP